MNNETVNQMLIRVWEGLNEHSKEVIDATPFNVLDECFGGMSTADEVNDFIESYFPEEEDM